MNDFVESERSEISDLKPVVEPPVFSERCRNFFVWIVTGLFVSYWVWGRTPAEETEKVAAKEDRLGNIVLRMQARYVVGAADLMKQGGSSLLEQVRSLNTGSPTGRLRFVIVAGELAGPTEALKHLEELRQQLAKNDEKPTSVETALMDILDRLYHDYARLALDAPSVTQAERELLTDKLEWFGELALAPAVRDLPGTSLPAVVGAAGAAALTPSGRPDPAIREEVLRGAHRTFVTTILALIVFLLLALVGLVGLILFVALALAGKVRSGLEIDATQGDGSTTIYGETFALWLLLFLGLSLTASQLAQELPPLLLVAAAMLLSLTVLAWPVLRGLPWARVRQDIGLTLGRQPALEPAIGVGCYTMALPMLLVGLLVTILLMFLRNLGEDENGAGPLGPAGRAAHPIVEYLVRADWWQRLQVVFLASVAAPVVEETMFRGVLYRHLRQASGHYPYVLSVLLSATLVSFIFAVIHPQGLLAVPVLMALAYGFTLAREWRGTLLPCMIGHGLSNGLVMLICILTLGD